MLFFQFGNLERNGNGEMLHCVIIISRNAHSAKLFNSIKDFFNSYFRMKKNDATLVAWVVMIKCVWLTDWGFDENTHDTYPNYHVRPGHRQRLLLCVHFWRFWSFWCVRPNVNDSYAYSMAMPIVVMNVTMDVAMNFDHLLFWILHWTFFTFERLYFSLFFSSPT